MRVRWGRSGLPSRSFLALKARGAVAKEKDNRNVIMIFNLGDAEPDRLVWIRNPTRLRRFGGRSSRQHENPTPSD